MIHYFAYGSNMDLTRMEERLGRPFKAARSALPDHALAFNKLSSDNPAAGYANIVPQVGETVHGILYTLTESELRVMDHHEGVASGHYRREVVTVTLHDGGTISAVTYVAGNKWVRQGLLPEEKYLAHLLAGRDFLPDHYVQKLEMQKVIHQP